MHFYVLVLALLAVALTDSARDPEVEKCHKKHPLDNYKPGMTFSKDQKCLVACLLEAKGVMKNGKIDLKKAISVGKTVCPKSDHMKNEKKCEGCIKKTEDEKDNCMKAYDFVECVDKKILDCIGEE